MKKSSKVWSIKFSMIVTYLYAVFTPTLYVYAAGDLGSGYSGSGGSNPLQNPLNVGSFPELMDSILKIVIQIGTPVAVLAVIYSGFLFVTAQGNEEKLKTAKSALVWSAIGTAVLLGSWVLAGAIGATINELKG